MSGISSRRLAKELSGLKGGCAAGINLIQADDFEIWILTVEVLGESIYKVFITKALCIWKSNIAQPFLLGRSLCSEIQIWLAISYVMSITTVERRPPKGCAPSLVAIESPEVVFVVNDQFKAPVHPHVYTNGHICASILGNEWSPVLNVESVCMTLQSMLASCKVCNHDRIISLLLSHRWSLEKGAVSGLDAVGASFGG